MAAAAEDKATALAKSTSRAGAEIRPNKIIKRPREKKQVKSVDLDAVLDAVEKNSPVSEDTQDERDRRSQGIIINGRTYTCATCKTGHRVGICKHARERPMTATHPPGRPPAGAPKKIICDCPKQCSCKKRDCKCARNCNCTQSMYMLVYVPAPDEEESTQEEKGIWKLGQQVTTDLKGNVLTPEQVRERLEQKEAQKTLTPDKRATSVALSATVLSRTSTSPKAEPKPKELGGCCKHKENVATRGGTVETIPNTGIVAKDAAGGCNCGTGCACAFCPQHPNNSVSMNVARQQAVHFANQPYNQDPQSIVSFTPTMPQGISCMGGLPEFAMSRYSQPPSSHEMQRAFPKPGYVIAYPIWSNRLDDAGFAVAPFPMQSHFVPDMNAMASGGINDLQQPMLGQPDESAHQGLPSLDFTTDEFDIGDAFVTSAGHGPWHENLVSPTTWSMEDPATTPVLGDFIDQSDYMNVNTVYSEPNMTSLYTPFDFSPGLDVSGNSHFFNMGGAQVTPKSLSAQPRTPSTSCCATSMSTIHPPESHLYASSHHSPSEKSAPFVALQP